MKILMRNSKNEKWHLVHSAGYKQEEELKLLISEQPSLILLNEVREGCGPLVAAVTEFPVDIGLNTGSIDLVAFTATGDIAIMECKLATNDDIKRKVIGQVLEYGANLWEMPFESLDERIYRRTSKRLADLIREFADDPSWDEESFRINVEANLLNGNFILMIVVDEIKEELSRIVRFINDAGRTYFSFAALEMRRFQHADTEMLVPHVFGSLKTAKPTTPRKKWDEITFFETLEAQHPEIVEITRKIYEWIRKNKNINRIWWGEGGITGSFVPVVSQNAIDYQLFAIYTYGKLEVFFQWLQYKPPFDKKENRLELFKKLNEIKGINLSEDAITRRPSIHLSIFKDDLVLQQLLNIFEWLIQEIKSS